jgi:hypothetical protein
VTETLRFEPDDFTPELPPQGFYPATVDVARYRRSLQGNEMIHVVFVLEGEAQGHRVSEYFVLGGSPRGQAISRRRLLQLFQVCGLAPKAGEEVSPADLFGHRLEVRVAHDEWDGRPCLRVTGYRRLDPARTPF